MNPTVLVSGPLVGSGAMPRAAEAGPRRFHGAATARPVAIVDGFLPPWPDSRPVTVIADTHHCWPVTEPSAVADAAGVLIDRLVA